MDKSKETHSGEERTSRLDRVSPSVDFRENRTYFESCFFDNLGTECAMSFHDEFKLRRVKHLFQLSTPVNCTGLVHGGRGTRESASVVEHNSKENFIHHLHQQRDGKWLKQRRLLAIAIFLLLSFLSLFLSPFLFPF